MGIDLYPELVHEGDLSPESFGSDIDDTCNEINEACAGFGTDEERLLKAMGGQNMVTRCKVAPRYKEMFDKELKEVMRSECGKRDFGTALQLLACNPVEAECDMINRACKGLGTKEFLLCTILCGRSNREMELLKKTYFDLNDKDMGQVLDSELGGDLEKLVFNVIQAMEDEEYDEEKYSDEKMEEDAATLYEMGQGNFGTNEKGMFKILVASPAEYLKKLNMAYADKYGFTLLKALETELGGNVRDAAMLMLGFKLKPYEEVAKIVHRACAGFGTDELLLTSTLIRYQKIMNEVKAAYVELYSETIEDKVKSETSRDYEALLLEVLATSNEVEA